MRPPGASGPNRNRIKGERRRQGVGLADLADDQVPPADVLHLEGPVGGSLTGSIGDHVAELHVAGAQRDIGGG